MLRMCNSAIDQLTNALLMRRRENAFEIEG